MPIRRDAGSWKTAFLRIAVGFGVSLAAIAIALLLRPLLEPVSNTCFDLYQRISPYDGAGRAVKIVDIDDSSLARIGRRPWSLRVLAELLDKLREAGAGVVGFDLRFAQPAMSASNDEEAEARFADAIARIPVVLGFDPVATGHGRGKVTAKAPISFVGPSGAAPALDLYSFPEAIADRQSLQTAAAGVGFAYVVDNHDGEVRQAPVVARLGSEIVPSFAAEVVRVAEGAHFYVGARGRYGLTGLRIGKQFVPTDDFGVVWLRYARPRSYHFIHAADVISGNFDPAQVAHQIVLVGVTAPSLGDRWNTPVVNSMPGVEILAQFVEQVLQGEAVTSPSWITGGEMVLALFAGFMLMALAHFGRAPLMVAAALLVAGVLAVSWYGFVHWHLAIDPVLPAAVIVLVSVAAATPVYSRR